MVGRGFWDGGGLFWGGLGRGVLGIVLVEDVVLLVGGWRLFLGGEVVHVAGAEVWDVSLGCGFEFSRRRFAGVKEVGRGVLRVGFGRWINHDYLMLDFFFFPKILFTGIAICSLCDFWVSSFANFCLIIETFIHRDNRALMSRRNLSVHAQIFAPNQHLCLTRDLITMLALQNPITLPWNLVTLNTSPILLIREHSIVHLNNLHSEGLFNDSSDIICLPPPYFFFLDFDLQLPITICLF